MALNRVSSPLHRLTASSCSSSSSASSLLRSRCYSSSSSSSSSSPPHRPTSTSSLTPFLLLAVGAGSIIYALDPTRAVRNEARDPQQKTGTRSDIMDVTETDWRQSSQIHGGLQTKGIFLWGNNKHKVTAPESASVETVKKPRPYLFFDGKVLRDLVLHEKYAVAVDEKGDVIQWGTGFFSPSVLESAPYQLRTVARPEPRITLRGKDIARVAASDDKIYALSRKGEVWVFPADEVRQGRRGGAGAGGGGGGGKSGSGSGGGDGWLGWLGLERDPGVDVEKLKTDVDLGSREKFVTISAGTDHLLALTSTGRSFSSPITLKANTTGQLGVRNVLINSISPDGSVSSSRNVQLIPDILKSPEEETDRQSLTSAPPTASSQVVDDPSLKGLDTAVVKGGETSPQERDIRFCTTLHEIPSLRGLKAAQLEAGDKHSLVRTDEGRVLGFGSNNYGQLALGPTLAFPSIPAPTESIISRSYPKTTRTTCTSISAGGNSSYFVVEREDVKNGNKGIDVLAAGNGQFGGIGNGQWSHQGTPTRVKTVSGLQEWNDKTQRVEPIPIHLISVGKTHTAIALDNAVQQAGAQFGRDVFVWGHNADYELGNGRRSNLSIPQHLPPLPYPQPAPVSSKDDVHSGTQSPMPHNRLQLAPDTKSQGKKVEETIVAGWGATGVYWKVLD